MEYIIFLVLMVIVGFFKFLPSLDKLSNGDKIIWYNSAGRFGYGRSYFIYKKHKL